MASSSISASAARRFLPRRALTFLVLLFAGFLCKETSAGPEILETLDKIKGEFGRGKTQDDPIRQSLAVTNQVLDAPDNLQETRQCVITGLKTLKGGVDLFKYVPIIGIKAKAASLKLQQFTIKFEKATQSVKTLHDKAKRGQEQVARAVSKLDRYEEAMSQGEAFAVNASNVVKQLDAILDFYGGVSCLPAALRGAFDQGAAAAEARVKQAFIQRLGGILARVAGVQGAAEKASNHQAPSTGAESTIHTATTYAGAALDIDLATQALSTGVESAIQSATASVLASLDVDLAIDVAKEAIPGKMPEVVDELVAFLEVASTDFYAALKEQVEETVQLSYDAALGSLMSAAEKTVLSVFFDNPAEREALRGATFLVEGIKVDMANVLPEWEEAMMEGMLKFFATLRDKRFGEVEALRDAVFENLTGVATGCLAEIGGTGGASSFDEMLASGIKGAAGRNAEEVLAKCLPGGPTAALKGAIRQALMTRFKAVIEDLAKVVLETKESVFEKLPSLAKVDKEHMEQLVRQVSAVSARMSDLSLEQVVSALEDAKSAAVEAAKASPLGVMLTAAVGIIEAGWKGGAMAIVRKLGVDAAAEALETALEEVAEKAVKTSITAALEAVNDTYAAAGFNSHLWMKVEEEFRAGIDEFGDQEEWKAWALISMRAAALDGMEAALTGIKSSCSAAVDLDKLFAPASQILNKLHNAMDAAQDAITPVGQLIQKANSMFEKLLKVFDKAVDATLSVVCTTIRTIENGVKKLVDWLENTRVCLPGVTYPADIGGLVESLPIRSSSRWVGGHRRRRWNPIKTVTNTVSSGASAIGSAAGSAAGAIGDGVDSAVNVVEDGADAAVDIAEDVGEGIVDFVESVKFDVYSFRDYMPDTCATPKDLLTLNFCVTIPNVCLPAGACLCDLFECHACLGGVVQSLEGIVDDALRSLSSLGGFELPLPSIEDILDPPDLDLAVLDFDLKLPTLPALPRLTSGGLALSSNWMSEPAKPPAMDSAVYANEDTSAGNAMKGTSSMGSADSANEDTSVGNAMKGTSSMGSADSANEEDTSVSEAMGCTSSRFTLLALVSVTAWLVGI